MTGINKNVNLPIGGIKGGISKEMIIMAAIIFVAVGIIVLFQHFYLPAKSTQDVEAVPTFEELFAQADVQIKISNFDEIIVKEVPAGKIVTMAIDGRDAGVKKLLFSRGTASSRMGTSLAPRQFGETEIITVVGDDVKTEILLKFV